VLELIKVDQSMATTHWTGWKTRWFRHVPHCPLKYLRVREETISSGYDCIFIDICYREVEYMG
jgi:hypothetical protein